LDNLSRGGLPSYPDGGGTRVQPPITFLDLTTPAPTNEEEEGDRIELLTVIMSKTELIRAVVSSWALPKSGPVLSSRGRWVLGCFVPRMTVGRSQRVLLASGHRGGLSLRRRVGVARGAAAGRLLGAADVLVTGPVTKVHK
jgi:hypothetical protein